MRMMTGRPTFTVRRCYLFSTFIASTICFVVLLSSVPIKWTPVVAIFPEYTTWHQVSSVHLMKILWRTVPSGVAPVKNCSRLYEPKVRREDIARLNINVFSVPEAEAKMKWLREKNGHPDLRRFLPILDRETKITLLYTYSVLSEALTNVGVSHVLLHGSLLGVQRFSGIAPWDDDMDVAINVTKWAIVRDTLSCTKGFQLFVDPEMRWSFFPRDAPSCAMPGKKYPFIDIFFQAEDDTHVWGMHWNNRRRSVFLKKMMFPAQWGYLDGIRVPVPYKSRDILESQYGDLSICASQEYGHLLPSKSVHTIPCSLLHPVYGNFSTKPHSQQQQHS